MMENPVPQGELVKSIDNDNEERPRSPLGRGNFLRMVSPFLRGQKKRPQLGRVRPM